MEKQESAHVLVAGSGLAGLATAVWLAEAGHRVTLVEKRGRLGGRTISFEVPGVEGHVDNGQHLFAGCYDALLRYVDTIGTRDQLVWDAPPFAIRTGPDQLLTLRAPTWLPGVLRRTVGLSWMFWPPIPLRERPAALRTWARIVRAALRPTPELDDLTVDRWFRRIGAPESLRALVLDQFVIGLLNEKTERVSASMFVQTLHWIGKRAMSGNTRAGDAVWPRVSLHDLFVAPAARYLSARGGEIVVGTGVTDLEITDDTLTGVHLSDGRVVEVDAAVLAVPPWSLTTLLDRGRLGQYDHFAPVRKIEPAPISSVYVWLDRPLRMRRLAENLRDTTIEWVFDTTGMHGVETNAGHCYSLAVSASWEVVHLPNAEFAAAALRSLAEHYPEVAHAEVLRTHVIHQPQATFSAQPGFDELRLPQRTPVDGLFLAGDWTDTGMPSTMESAAESAVRAVDRVRELFTRRAAKAQVADQL
ncbi:hydroxysqualene dehydroxylase HpnE [Nocardia caishijiensis]|uniref:Squalene-associated FAD-dependent desaturase n=1 Tax=Nocardia caishijiensis TaxID=184756 RepID=A0ABQ6YMT2_9NOCA|nr:hydroxysqualene dehydroxylase HpnE [Nocardia caishijiensis]KAF0847088.1 squalene-associated FAD-dependent desaturase [Nocardia caishijiensis]